MGDLIARYFASLLLGMFLAGVASVLILGALVYGIYWLCTHIDVSWVS